MDHFHYRGDHYFAEDVSLEQIAKDVGTPCYVYSRATMEHHWKVFDAAFGDYPHTILYAVKANGNLGVLNLLSRLGSGFDIVSGGELERVLQAGGRASEVVFSGVGKSEAEINRALEVGVRCLNLESAAELERVNRLAGDLGVTAPVALRINPDVDPGTHPYIATGLRENKFGIPVEEARCLYRLARDCQHVEVTGVACHIGSQLTQLLPFTDALDRVLDFVFALLDEGLSV
ncbi:MAG: alanine racemase, partial [Pseudomonadota bacterium]|nr:alanine racemase [Pseudomonadota bacterium]